MGEIHNCRICGNTDNNVTYTGTEMMYGMRETFEYFQCSSCKCLQICEFPENIAKYYPTDYYAFEPYTGKKFNSRLKRWIYANSLYRRNWLQRLSHRMIPATQYDVLQSLPIHKSMRILDVGCGRAHHFLYPLAVLGFDQIAGCDPYIPEQINYDNGLIVHKKEIFEMQGQWDLITYHHSFEHVPDPLEHLKKVRSLLAEDGVCIIRIPTVSSWAWEHYGVSWVQMDAPRHFYLHSKESMDHLAGSAGMEVFDVLYDSTHFQFSGSEKYLKNQSLNEPRPKGLTNFIKRKWLKNSYSRKAKTLNAQGHGDQAAFFLRLV